MVWIESITTNDGLKYSILAKILSTSVSFKTERLARGLILSTLILICCADSSPAIYNVFSTFTASCVSKVDLPIPGSPETSTKEPPTTPPPKTLSNSSNLVLILLKSVFCILDSSIIPLPVSLFPPNEFRAAGGEDSNCSTKEFQESH